MNHLNNTCSCTHATKERIAFDLMLTIAENSTESHTQQRVGNDVDAPADGDFWPLARTKEYWLDLYTECLTTVNHKRRSTKV